MVRRAERVRFTVEGEASVSRHDQLIEFLASGDVEQAAAVTFDTWHSLTVEDATTGDQPRETA